MQIFGPGLVLVLVRRLLTLSALGITSVLKLLFIDLVSNENGSQQFFWINSYLSRKTSCDVSMVKNLKIINCFDKFLNTGTLTWKCALNVLISLVIQASILMCWVNTLFINK